MTRRTGVLLAALVLVAGCGRGDSDFEVGIKRVALALAFADEELAEPVQPRIIRQFVPVPPEVDLSSPEPIVVRPEIVNPLACPTMPPGAVPVGAVTRTVEEPPATGTYLRHNSGTIEISGGLAPITLPFPPLTQWQIPDVETVPREPGAFAGTPFDATPPGDDHLVEIRKILADGVFVVTDRVRIGGNGIELLTRTTEADGTTTTFTPDPPIVVYQYGAENTRWRSAGVDTETDTAMLVEGTIERREVVDVCGEAIDTYRVRVQESVVNLETGETSGTDLERPNVYNVATHHGGLVVREDVRSTTRARDPESGAPLTIVFEYVSTANAVEPLSL